MLDAGEGERTNLPQGRAPKLVIQKQVVSTEIIYVQATLNRVSSECVKQSKKNRPWFGKEQGRNKTGVLEEEKEKGNEKLYSN